MNATNRTLLSLLHSFMTGIYTKFSLFIHSFINGAKWKMFLHIKNSSHLCVTASFPDFKTLSLIPRRRHIHNTVCSNPLLGNLEKEMCKGNSGSCISLKTPCNVVEWGRGLYDHRTDVEEFDHTSRVELGLW